MSQGCSYAVQCRSGDRAARPGDITNAGTDLANYILPTSAMGPGTINRAMLTAAIIGNLTRIQRHHRCRANRRHQLIGSFIAGEGATINQATGNYDTPNAGARTVTVILASQDFAAECGHAARKLCTACQRERRRVSTAPC